MNVETVRSSTASIAITPDRKFGDARGFFSETWNAGALRRSGRRTPQFVQDNQSLSRDRGVVRGLHCQVGPNAQGKLVRCHTRRDLGRGGRRAPGIADLWPLGRGSS